MPRKKKAPAETALIPVIETADLSYTRADALYRNDGTLDSLCEVIKGPDEIPADARRRVVELMRDNPDMAQFVEAADLSLKRGGAFPSLDALADKCGMRRSEVVGAMAEALHEHGFNYAKIVAAAGAARVMTTLVNQAAHPDGVADRRTFVTEVMPFQPRGGGIHITNTAQAKGGDIEMPGARYEQGPEKETFALPVFEQEQADAAKALREVQWQK